jgi:predicted Zn-ribbon and HTH transcriptional regulator
LRNKQTLNHVLYKELLRIEKDLKRKSLELSLIPQCQRSKGLQGIKDQANLEILKTI